MKDRLTINAKKLNDILHLIKSVQDQVKDVIDEIYEMVEDCDDER